MRIPRSLLLALASFSAAILAEDPSFIRGYLSEPAGNGHPERLDMAERYPLPEPQCGSWVGVEVIFMVEVTEVCPEGSTVTETLTQCVETLTRSICATATTNRPCYPCVMGTPPPSDTATVTVTSCATATDETMTVTVQLCSTCTTTTYVGPIPGYTPGGPCHGCTPFNTETSPFCSEEGGSATPDVTTTTTSTSTSTVSESDCAESDVSSTATTTPPDNPFLSSTTTSATNTPYQPTTTATTITTTGAPPAVTAGSARNGVAGFAVLIVGWTMVIVYLGM